MIVPKMPVGSHPEIRCSPRKQGADCCGWGDEVDRFHSQWWLGMSVTQHASSVPGDCVAWCSLLPRLQAYQLTAGLLGLALESWGLGVEVGVGRGISLAEPAGSAG